MSITIKYKILPLLIIQLLAGCTSLLPRPKSDSLYRDFLDGDIRLECGISCAWTFGTSVPTLMQLYNAGLWKDLAEKVYTIGFNQNVSYFLLGRAAEELNKLSAAENYYKLSKVSSSCAFNGRAGCAGFTFPDIVDYRLSVVRTAQERLKAIEANKKQADIKKNDFIVNKTSAQKCIDLGFEINTEKFKTCVEKSHQ